MFWTRLAFSRTTILLALIAGIVISLLLISVSGHSGVWRALTPETDHSPSTAQGGKGERLEVEVVTITPDGFDPQEIERPAGPFVLSVTNRSGSDLLNLRIDSEQHGRFRDKALPLNTPYWRERINPPRGRYVVTEADHPEWTLTFVIR